MRPITQPLNPKSFKTVISKSKLQDGVNINLAGVTALSKSTVVSLNKKEILSRG